MLHDSEELSIRVVPGMPGCVVGRRGVAAVGELALPVRLTFEIHTMASTAFGLVDHSTPRDFRCVLGIGGGSRVRQKNQDNDPHRSEHEDSAHGEDPANGSVPPGSAAVANDPARSLLFLAHSLSGH